jgi:fructose/tagatose bisphosphate aldolase
MGFIVFPGNVGQNDTLCRVAEKLGVEKKLGAAESESDISFPPLSVPQLQSLRATNRTFQLLHRVKRVAQAIAAFNVYNLEGAKAVVDAANELQSPVILQVCPLSVSRSDSSLMAQIHPSSLVFGGSELLTLLSAYRHSSAVPVAIHLDHITDERHLYEALDMKTSDGKPLLDSVMVDGSALPLEQNILWTKKMASYAHQRGVVVEAELGRLAGEEVDLLSPHSTSPVLIASQDGLSIPDVEAKMTDPAVVEEFLTRTQVRWDLLLFQLPPLQMPSSLTELIHQAIVEGQICKLKTS